MNRNKARVATRNMAMSRQKKLDKMEVIELASEAKTKIEFKTSRAPGRYIFQAEDLVIDDRPLTGHVNLEMERGQKIAIVGKWDWENDTTQEFIRKLLSH